MGLIFKKSTAQPSFTVAAAITGTTEATQTLTCAYTVVRARAVNVTVRWYRHTADDGSDPTGALLGTGSTYTLTGTDVGNYIRAIVTAINPAGTVQSTTAYTAIITSGDPPEPPALVTPAAITGTADVGETLTVTYSFTGQDSVAIQWYSYATEPTGSPLAGTDEVTLGTASTQSLTESESGRWIVAVVTATNTVDSTVTSASVAMAGVDPYAPIAPAQYTVPAYDDSTLQAVYCNSGDDLQAKLNQLRPGQKLVLEAGASWTGNYIVPNTYLGASARAILEEAEDPSFDQWAYIVSSAYASLPAEGVRVAPSDATNMPKIQTGTYISFTDSSFSALPDRSEVANPAEVAWTPGQSYSVKDIRTGNVTDDSPNKGEQFYVCIQAHTASAEQAFDSSYVGTYWRICYVNSNAGRALNGKDGSASLSIVGGVSKLRIVGVEITTPYKWHNAIERELFAIGRYDADWSYATVGGGQDLVVDRCYVHGTPTGRNRDGVVIGWGVTGIGIVDSYIDDFKGVTTESHGIHIVSSNGPILVRNNAVIAAGINVFLAFGSGGGITFTESPTDQTFLRNYIGKKLAWKADDPSYTAMPYGSGNTANAPVATKNMFESKGSKRTLIRGNVFENAWANDQPGQGYEATNDGGTGVWDVEIRDNIYHNIGVGIQLANPYDNGRGFGFQRIRMQNNLYYKMSSVTAVSGLSTMLFGNNGGTGFGRYLTIRHNTFVFAAQLPTSLLTFNSATASGLVGLRVYDNIFRQSSDGVGVFGSGLAAGRAAALFHVTDFDFNTNVSVGESFSQYSTTFDDWRNWKSGSTGGIWGNSSVGYVSVAFTELGHFALSGSSQFKNAATDGTDIGADISAIAAQINASDNPFGA